MPPQHQVSPVCPHPGSSAFWFSRGLLCDASSPKAGWDLRVYPTPQDPEDMPGCPGPHSAHLSSQYKPELRRGAALCEPADYTLDVGTKKAAFSLQICSGCGLSAFRVLIIC